MKNLANAKLPVYIVEQATILVNCDEREKVIPSHDGESVIMYEYESVRMSKSNFNYSSLVSALITERYSNDRMTAIINNHLLEVNNSEHEQEYQEMQAWRQTVKDVARQIFPSEN